MDNGNYVKKRRNKIGIQIKICILIVLGALVINKYNAPLGEKISETLKLNEDYKVEEVVAAVYMAVGEAQAVMSEAIETFSSESAVNEG